MNAFQKILGGLLQKAAAYGGVNLTLTDPRGWGPVIGGNTYTGKSINDQTAMQVATVWTCVRILAETIGSLPRSFYRQDASGNAEPIEYPYAAALVESPNKDMTPVEFFEAEVVNLCLRGNAYALKDTFSSTGRLLSLYPMLAQNVMPERTPSGDIVYKYNDRGRVETYPADKIWHVKGFGSSGLVGYSPIANMRQAIGLALAAEEFGARFFGQGAKPSGFVSIPEWLKEDQRKVAREIVAQKWSGLDNAQAVQLLEGGMSYTAVTMPLEDAQFLETRKFQRGDIFGIYRIPPHMGADLERATFSNMEQSSQDFVTYALLPWLVRFEKSAEKWLIAPADRGKVFLRHNVDGLLRADAAARGTFYAQMLQNGVYSRNEVRALENMNRVKGLDDYTVQTNMTPVDKLASIVAAQISKPSQATPAP